MKLGEQKSLYTMKEKTRYDIFISYSRKDIAVADKICAALDKQGISYFIDRRGIGGGMEFPNVLAQAIMESRILLFLASENSYASKFTIKEITFAFNEKPSGALLPYVIDGSTLPANFRFTFADINIRTIEEHPIDTVLMKDLCNLLGYPYKSEQMLEEERRRTEETIRQELEKDYKMRLDKELQRLLREGVNSVKSELNIADSRENGQNEIEGGDEGRKSSENGEDKGGCLAVLAFLFPLMMLAAGIWYGIKLNSFWYGLEIFILPGWSLFWGCLALSDKSSRWLGFGLALVAISIAVGIHVGIYMSSVLYGLITAIILSCISFFVAGKGL